jgi:DNA-binding NarL/FixJ family response regulator
MVVLYLTGDLLFSSRVSGAAANLGVPLQIAGSVDKLQELASNNAARLVLIDLTLAGVDLQATVPAIRTKAPQAKIVAYGPHVHEEALAAASAAGCDEVLSRGQFDREFGRLLREAK